MPKTVRSFEPADLERWAELLEAFNVNYGSSVAAVPSFTARNARPWTSMSCPTGRPPTWSGCATCSVTSPPSPSPDRRQQARISPRSFSSNCEITNWHTTVGHIDVMVGIPDADGGPVVFDELLERGVRMQLGGTWVVVADLADIVVSKEHANRAKDRQALPELYRLLETQRQPPPPSLGLDR